MTKLPDKVKRLATQYMAEHFDETQTTTAAYSGLIK